MEKKKITSFGSSCPNFFSNFGSWMLYKLTLFGQQLPNLNTFFGQQLPKFITFFGHQLPKIHNYFGSTFPNKITKFGSGYPNNAAKKKKLNSHFLRSASHEYLFADFQKTNPPSQWYFHYTNTTTLCKKWKPYRNAKAIFKEACQTSAPIHTMQQCEGVHWDVFN